LKGAIVLSQPMMTNFVRKDRPQPSDPDYLPMSAAYATSVGRGRGAAAAGETPQQRAQRVASALKDAGAAVVIKPSVGEHGTVFVTGRDGGNGAVPSVTLSGEHYNMIARYLEAGIPVKLRVNVQTTFNDDNGNAYNVLAELPGTDPVLKDEVVMIGAHLDSWHTGVGATDNADGVTTVVEAMRILKAIDARPRRTIRVALWAGESRGCSGQARVAQLGRRRQRRRARQVLRNSTSTTAPVRFGWYWNQEEVRPTSTAGWSCQGHRRTPQCHRAGRVDRSSESSTLVCPASSDQITATTTSARTTPTWTPWNA
jgi:hypothetical protein